MLRIKEINNREDWDNFLVSQNVSAFTQSWSWGELQENLGRKIWRFFIIDDDITVGAALIIKYPLPFKKSYLYIPHGPILNNKCHNLDGFWVLMNKIAVQENAIFIRFTDNSANILKSAKPTPKNAYRSAVTQPRFEWMVNLSESEEIILKKMHEKTRYNIRLSQKKDLTVNIYNNVDINKQINNFYQLLKITADRDKFSLHPQEHYNKIINCFKKNISLISVYKNDIQLASGLIIFFGNTATYLFGASSNEQRNLMAPYLMHWEAMRIAKQKNCTWYSFGAINDTDLKSITRFKQGFGGELIDFRPSFDTIINLKWYYAYNAGRLLKKI